MTFRRTVQLQVVTVLSVVSAGSPARRSTHTRRVRCHTAVHQGRRHHGHHHAHLHGRHRRLLRLHHPEGEADDGGGGVGSVCSVLGTVIVAGRLRWERIPPLYDIKMNYCNVIVL